MPGEYISEPKWEPAFKEYSPGSALSSPSVLAVLTPSRAGFSRAHVSAHHAWQDPRSTPTAGCCRAQHLHLSPHPSSLHVSSVIHLRVSILSPRQLPRSSPGFLASMSVSPAKTASLSPIPRNAGAEPLTGTASGQCSRSKALNTQLHRLSRPHRLERGLTHRAH